MTVHISIELVHEGELPESSVDELVSMLNRMEGDPDDLFTWLGDMVTQNPNWAVLTGVSETIPLFPPGYEFTSEEEPPKVDMVGIARQLKEATEEATALIVPANASAEDRSEIFKHLLRVVDLSTKLQMAYEGIDW